MLGRAASEIYITENGCSATDLPAADGVVYDTDRIMFLRSYLTQFWMFGSSHVK